MTRFQLTNACQYCNFDGQSLSSLQFQNADLRGVSLVGADLRGTDFRRANLSNSKLRDARIQNAIFDYAKLRNSDLRGVHGVAAQRRVRVRRHVFRLDEHARADSICTGNLGRERCYRRSGAGAPASPCDCWLEGCSRQRRCAEQYEAHCCKYCAARAARVHE